MKVFYFLLFTLGIAFRKVFVPVSNRRTSLKLTTRISEKCGEVVKKERRSILDRIKKRTVEKTKYANLDDSVHVQQNEIPKELIEHSKRIATLIKSENLGNSMEQMELLQNDSFRTHILMGGEPVNPNFKSGFVTIIGNPNVGKSTLMNTLLNQTLSIVNPKPQTTRHRIKGILTTDDYQMIITDTPGLLMPRYKLQATMRQVIHKTFHSDDPEAIVVMTDVYCEPLADYVMYEKLYNSTAPIVVVVNKLDLIYNQTNTIYHSKAHRKASSKHDSMQYASIIHTNNRTRKSWDEIVTFWQTLLPQAEIIGISARTRYNVPVLLDHLLQYLPHGPRYYGEDITSDRDERFFVAEIIRECILSQYKNEVPYSVEVTIESFRDVTETFSEIRARINVNRRTQLPIIIGKHGDQLKQLGIAAKTKIEQLLDRKVYLSLKVAVDSDWRDNPKRLQRYGYLNG